MRCGVGEEKARLGANRSRHYFFIALEKSQEETSHPEWHSHRERAEGTGQEAEAVRARAVCGFLFPA